MCVCVCVTSRLQVQAWARQHQQRLATALTELLTTQELLENLLTWLHWAETNLSDKDKEPLPQEIEEVKNLIAEHQVKKISGGKRAYLLLSNLWRSTGKNPSPAGVHGGNDQEAARCRQNHQDAQAEGSRGNPEPVSDPSVWQRKSGTYVSHERLLMKRDLGHLHRR